MSLVMADSVYRISVRNLVEFILRSGDLDSRVRAVPDAEAMLMGSRAHRRIQGSQGGTYRAEVMLKDEIAYDDLTLRIEGRADGIFTTEEDLVVIDEIKGVLKDVWAMEAPEPVHLAQARVYAAIYMEQQGLDEIGVRMTYVNLDSEGPRQLSLTDNGGKAKSSRSGKDSDIRFFNFRYKKEENLAWYRGVADEYHKWLSLRQQHRLKRNESMEALTFPFPYRKGQKALVASVYRAIESGRQLFIEAPTGVGKTMAVMYPAVRALGEGKADRLFYLTAKAVTRAVAVEALRILSGKGLFFHYTVMMAKEKLCPMHETACNPDDCPYACGHYDRVNEAAYHLLETETVIDSAALLRSAEAFKVCPFELMLDVSVWTDAIICDYNYAFDPNVRLKRFFGESEKPSAILLVDEAHNLVDRGKEMFSACLNKADVLAARKLVREHSKKLDRDLTALNKKLLEMKHRCEEEDSGIIRLKDEDSLQMTLLRLAGDMQEFFENHREAGLFEAMADFYFEVRDMLAAYERFTDSYLSYAALTDGEKTSQASDKQTSGKTDIAVHIACMNPAGDLQEVMDRVLSTVFFSATLLPVDYYKKHLSAREDDPAVYAGTPFLPEQRRILIGRHVSTVYKARGIDMYRRIAGYIHDTVTAHRGNYMVFFPSYKLMEDVLAVYRKECDEPDVNWVTQSRSMWEEDREIFLENFYEDPRMTCVGFCVMGGIFSEGIDLIGSRLIGAIVVGTGLPQVSPEREILRRYYDERGMDGFGYAYRIPGMNKVLQAAGRVIRTDRDRGVIVLLDDRFLGRDYTPLFPREWRDAAVVEAAEVREVLSGFWGNSDKNADGG